MIRFAIKAAALVALVAFFMPRDHENGAAGDKSPALSPIVMFYGATQAVSDLGSFCDRVPAACSSGGEALRYAGNRILDGMGILYAMVAERGGNASPPPATRLQNPATAARPVRQEPRQTVARAPAAPGFETTGSIAPAVGPQTREASRPRPYTPPATSGAAAPGARSRPLAAPTPVARPAPQASVAAADRRTAPPRLAAPQKGAFGMPGMRQAADKNEPRPQAQVPPAMPARLPQPTLAPPRA